jgi:hypothetical protein
LNVLSLGDFSLHEQREVARSLDASGNANGRANMKRQGQQEPVSRFRGNGKDSINSRLKASEAV